MIEERTGEAFELGEQLTVVGKKLAPGEPAPPFELDHFDGDVMGSVRLTDSDGRVRLISTVNSLDTPVCDTSTRFWEGIRANLPPDMVIYTVSMDLPFAQARWRSSADAGHIALASHRS